jgi:hypothetical protein
VEKEAVATRLPTRDHGNGKPAKFITLVTQPGVINIGDEAKATPNKALKFIHLLIRRQTLT